MVIRSQRCAELFYVVPVGVSFFRYPQATRLYELRPLPEEQAHVVMGGKISVARVIHEKPFPLNMDPVDRQAEYRDRNRFLTMLNHMLCVNPLDRAPVERLLTSPFITVEVQMVVEGREWMKNRRLSFEVPRPREVKFGGHHK